MPLSPVEKDSRVVLRMGRSRSRTLPSLQRADAPDHGIAVASAGNHSRGDVSGRLGQAGELQGPVLQPTSHRTPILKGRAPIQLGSNPAPSERQLVEEFQFSNDWSDSNHKRRISSFLSPGSIQEDEPERKRARDKRLEPETVIDKLQTDGLHDTAAIFRSSNVESPAVMLKHNINIQTPDGYAENVGDHVKTLHRSMGPMKKKRLGGLAQLKLQRELRKEQPNEYSSKPPDTVGTAGRRDEEG
ncbi:hypothetical protein LX32DRAFT_444511 [Colletotrichum zoysiae]|uniref:Uncharacterized protein n=1 Tax=Colletotrichum zoysiae TaxID=1216348 RepID=A0AAD9M4J6_9PEZI|nr:hypothetical protein LX32DRAFT_444511 [Colletotrichum zoysiae]